MTSEPRTTHAALRAAYEAGHAYAVGSHEDFTQTHKTFDEWLAEHPDLADLELTDARAGKGATDES